MPARRIHDLVTSEQTTPPPSWIGEGILPRSGLLLLGGEAKIGKTFLMFNLADALLRGESLFGFSVPVACPVLLVEQEIGHWELQRRARLFYGATPPPNDFWYISRDPTIHFDSMSGVKRLHDEIKMTGACVVFLDPIARFMLGDENSAMYVGSVMRALDELMVSFQDRGLSIVISHHFAKPAQKLEDMRDPLSPYNFRGSSKWFDGPDTLITAVRTEGVNEEWWRLKTDWTTRQGKSPGRLPLRVREGGRMDVALVEEAALKPLEI